MITIEQLAAQSLAQRRPRSTCTLDPCTMQHFGDTLDNFEVRGPVTVVTFAQERLEAWELARLQPVAGAAWPKSPRQGAVYFAVSDCRELEMCRPV